jgi:hypothetical protein
MKIMRYFPLIALAFLGFILYGLFKTSSFINKKADAKALLLQDSIVNNAPNHGAVSTNPVLADTLATATTLTAPVVATVPSSSPTVSAKQEQRSAAKKDPASAEPVTATANSVPTLLSTPMPVPKRAKKTPSKATVATESGNATSTEPAKPEPKKAIDKGTGTKATPSTSSTAIAAKGDVPKSASIAVKKEASETSYHVIIGSYTQEANANARAAAFEQKNKKKAKIIKQGGYYRVCADEFEFAQAASQYAQKLKEAGEDNMILKF